MVDTASVVALQTDFGPLTETVLWATTIAMALGAAALYWKGKDLTGEGAEHAAVSVMIPAWAAAMYLAMAVGYGVTTIELNPVFMEVANTQQEVFWARYADWVVTTPLLLLDLAMVAGADRNTIGTLVGVDAYMIVTGLIASFTAIPFYRYVWWVVSTGAFLFLLYAIVAKLPEFVEDKSPGRQDTFDTLQRMLIGLWLVYPVIWIVGTEGFGIVGLGIETLVYAVLDFSAKVVFGWVLLSGVSDYAGRETPAETTTGATAGGD